jgi:small lipoprotein (TIGR04454 family)
MTRHLPIWVVLALAFGCQKTDSGPSCDAVIDHVLAITKAGLTGHDGMQLGNRKQMIDGCVQRKLPAATRTCLLAAKDLAGLAGCKAGAPAAAGGSPAMPASPSVPAAPTAPAAPPAPAAGSGQ